MDSQCAFVWKLARRHTWSSPIDERALLALTLDGTDHDVGRDAFHDLIDRVEFVVRGPRGYRIPDGRPAHVTAASFLDEECGVAPYRIGATLSRVPPDTEY
jgi:hypothetical protein